MSVFLGIGAVSELLGVPQHNLRFWESRFSEVRPVKRAGGRRYYREPDVELLRGIRRLLHAEGYTIRGVQRMLKVKGPSHLRAIGRGEAEANALASSKRGLADA